MINQVNNQELNTINWRDSIHSYSAKMTTEQVVETSVTVNSNSPIQDYVNREPNLLVNRNNVKLSAHVSISSLPLPPDFLTE